MSFWEIKIGKWRPIYTLGLLYLRYSPFDVFKEFLRHGVAGHTESPIIFTNRDGITFSLDMSSFIERFIYCFHYYEPGDVAVVRRFLKPGHVMIDVGANVGQYALLASKMVAETGVVYAFEPSHEVLVTLNRNRDLNEKDNLLIVPCGVGSAPGTFDFYPGVGDNQGIGSFLPAGEHYTGLRSNKAIKVNVVTLDSFCEEQAITRVDFIKIDAEGYDLEVLKGAETILMQNQGIVVMVEIE